MEKGLANLSNILTDYFSSAPSQRDALLRTSLSFVTARANFKNYNYLIDVFWPSGSSLSINNISDQNSDLMFKSSPTFQTMESVIRDWLSSPLSLGSPIVTGYLDDFIITIAMIGIADFFYAAFSAPITTTQNILLASYSKQKMPEGGKTTISWFLWLSVAFYSLFQILPLAVGTYLISRNGDDLSFFQTESLMKKFYLNSLESGLLNLGPTSVYYGAYVKEWFDLE